jgi:hypothetical protein
MPQILNICLLTPLTKTPLDNREFTRSGQKQNRKLFGWLDAKPSPGRIFYGCFALSFSFPNVTIF